MLGLNGEALQRHSEMWGPSAHVCIALERNSAFVQDLTLDVQGAATTFVQNFIPGNQLNAIMVSHKLFAIRPEDEERYRMVAEIATKHIEGYIMDATIAADSCRRHDFFTLMSRHPYFKSSAGYMFEKFFFAWFIGCPKPPVKLHCTPSQDRMMGFWIVPPLKTKFISGVSSLKHTKEDLDSFGWVPISQAFPAANAIACTKKLLLTIQVTISPQHSTKLKGFEDIQRNFPKQFLACRTWHHLFVTDNEDNAQSLRDKTYQELLELPYPIHVYSAVLDVSKLGVRSDPFTLTEEKWVSGHWLLFLGTQPENAPG